MKLQNEYTHHFLEVKCGTWVPEHKQDTINGSNYKLSNSFVSSISVNIWPKVFHIVHSGRTNISFQDTYKLFNGFKKIHMKHIDSQFKLLQFRC